MRYLAVLKGRKERSRGRGFELDEAPSSAGTEELAQADETLCFESFVSKTKGGVMVKIEAGKQKDKKKGEKEERKRKKEEREEKKRREKGKGK